MSASIGLKKGKVKIPKGKDNYGDSYPYIAEFLAKTAQKLGVDSPKSFEFEDPAFYDEVFPPDELPPEVRRRLKTQKEWHPASSGLRTFSALLEHFRKREPRVEAALQKQNTSSDVVIYELEVFVSILHHAAKSKDMFRIIAA